MMKIKNKQFFNRKILMTLVVGTNVILGGTAVYAEEPQKFTLDEYVVTATYPYRIEQKRSSSECGSYNKRGYPEYWGNQCYRCLTYGD